MRARERAGAREEVLAREPGIIKGRNPPHYQLQPSYQTGCNQGPLTKKRIIPAGLCRMSEGRQLSLVSLESLFTNFIPPHIHHKQLYFTPVLLLLLVRVIGEKEKYLEKKRAVFSTNMIVTEV